jgi:type IV pilus assembly protein PilC
VGDGLALLAQESTCRADRELLQGLADQLDSGEPLADALRDSGRFPDYVSGLIQVGERAGRTEEALSALSRYYEDRARLEQRTRSALLYPAVMLLLMLVVIVVLLSRVLPVFRDVYASLGGQMTGVAGGLLVLGQALDGVMPVLCAVLAAVVLFLAAFAAGGSFREWVLGLCRKLWGDRGLSRQLNCARFAQAMAMGLRSGLPIEQALELSGQLQKDVPPAQARCQDCLTRLERGEDLADALRQSQVLPASACRLLALGQRSGTGDAVMEEVARRLTQEAELTVETKVSRVEPTLVLVTSVLVGVILLSVMLPLMNILTAIG